MNSYGFDEEWFLFFKPIDFGGRGRPHVLTALSRILGRGGLQVPVGN